MRILKQSFVKRVFVLMLCTVVLSSTVFLSYENTMAVKAADESDLIYDFVVVALAAVGVFATGGTAGALALAIAPGLAASGKDIYDYVIENEDGTTTISADFVNLVLQAYQEYTKQIFDGTLDYDDQTMRYIYGSSSYKLTGRNNTSYASQISGFESYYPVAFLLVAGTTEYKYASWGTSTFNPENKTTGYGGFLFYYNLNPDSNGDGIQSVSRFPDTLPVKPTTIMYNDGVARNPIEGFYVQNISGPGVSDPYFISFDSGTIPVYTSFDMMRSAFHSGDYTSAENYTVGGSSAGQTSSYTGEYTGGDITVETEKLNDISDKLAELEESNSNIEDILKDLLEWLKLNGGGESSGSGGSNVTVNIDLSTTNSWLEKIYLKVSQIFDKLQSSGSDESSGGIIDAAFANIQESLDEIIEQLKKIKRWTAVDTVIDGVDAVADWLDLIRDVLEDGAGSAVAALSSALSDSTDLMKQKFPFSIPWDILFFVTVLSAEPETPQFSIPFNFEFSALDLSVDYEMELDFTPFQWLSDLSRLLLSLTYAAGLMKKTVDIVSANKEG